MEHNFFQISKNNYAKFLLDGHEYQEEFLKLIKDAKKVIHLQTYIFMMDDFGKKVHAELIEAARRKVQIFVLVDSVGSRLFKQEAEDQLTNAGIQFLRFNSLQIKWLYSWGRRLHHKILLIDQETCIVGGINVIDPFDKIHNIPQLDFALLLRGPVVARLSQYCEMIFKISLRKKVTFPHISHNQSFPGGVEVKILVNDWVYRRWQITKQYAHMTTKAKKEIIIISSYFFPRFSFMRQLVAARRRGVRVRLILPKYSDWPSYILASEFLYAHFLKNDIEIYQWKKSILHGKLATIDDRWATIGSFNLDYTSYQQNIEMNVKIYSEEFVKKLKYEINNMIKEGCEKLDANTFLKKSSLFLKLKRFSYYIILSIIANYSVGLIYQEDGNREHRLNRIYNVLRIGGATIFLFLGIFGIIFPIIPGIPFLALSALLVTKQIVLNRKKEAR